MKTIAIALMCIAGCGSPFTAETEDVDRSPVPVTDMKPEASKEAEAGSATEASIVVAHDSGVEAEAEAEPSPTRDGGLPDALPDVQPEASPDCDGVSLDPACGPTTASGTPVAYPCGMTGCVQGYSGGQAVCRSFLAQTENADGEVSTYCGSGGVACQNCAPILGANGYPGQCGSSGVPSGDDPDTYSCN
jgi:hypothetical protein